MLYLKMVRATLLAAGGVALAMSGSLYYEGNHRWTTVMAWMMGGALLLLAGAATWKLLAEKSPGQEDGQRVQALPAVDTEGRVGIDNDGDMELEDVFLGPDLDTSLKNRSGGRIKGRGIRVE